MLISDIVRLYSELTFNFLYACCQQAHSLIRKLNSCHLHTILSYLLFKRSYRPFLHQAVCARRFTSASLSLLSSPGPLQRRSCSLFYIITLPTVNTFFPLPLNFFTLPKVFNMVGQRVQKK
jgi:hypothetical protein